MSCCPGNIIPFAGAAETNIPYAGWAPFVQVVYFIDGVFVSNPHSSGIFVTPGNVRVNHGGVSSGFIIVK